MWMPGGEVIRINISLSLPPVTEIEGAKIKKYMKNERKRRWYDQNKDKERYNKKMKEGLIQRIT